MKLSIEGYFDSVNIGTNEAQRDYNSITNFGVNVILSSLARLDTKRWRSIRLLDLNDDTISEMNATFFLENLQIGSFRLQSSARFDASQVLSDVYKIQMVGGSASDSGVIATANVSPPLSSGSSYLIVRNDSITQ